MKKQLSSVYLSILVGVCTSVLYAAVGKSVKPDTVINTQVLSCSGEGTICNYSLNAVNDLKNIDVRVRPQKLGVITDERKAEFSIPRIGGQLLFSLRTTQPFSSDVLDLDLVNKPMEVLIVSTLPSQQSLKSDPNALFEIGIYRRMSQESLWAERALIPMPVLPSDIVESSVVIHANGDADFMFFDQKKTIYLGQAQ